MQGLWGREDERITDRPDGHSKPSLFSYQLINRSDDSSPGVKLYSICTCDNQSTSLKTRVGKVDFQGCFKRVACRR